MEGGKGRDGNSLAVMAARERERESKVQEMTWKTFAATFFHPLVHTYKMEGGGFMKRMSRRYRLFAVPNEREVLADGRVN